MSSRHSFLRNKESILSCLSRSHLGSHDRPAYICRYRVYCANSACEKFLHPSGHIKDTDTNITYAVCDSDDCFQATCCSCKTLLPDGIDSHTCKGKDSDQMFKEIANKNGYKECFVCGATVELAEGKFHDAQIFGMDETLTITQLATILRANAETASATFAEKAGPARTAARSMVQLTTIATVTTRKATIETPA
jgi:hypothetical protein